MAGMKACAAYKKLALGFHFQSTANRWAGLALHHRPVRPGQGVALEPEEQLEGRASARPSRVGGLSSLALASQGEQERESHLFRHSLFLCQALRLGPASLGGRTPARTVTALPPHPPRPVAAALPAAPGVPSSVPCALGLASSLPSHWVRG